MTILSQRDSRWASIKLGTDASKTTIGSHGCLVTCLAMVAGTTPDDLNTRLKSVQGFKDDLVVWSKIKDAIPFDFSTPLTYDNDKVIAEIEKNGFCVVEVDFDGKIESPALLAQIGDFNFLYATGILFAASALLIVVASLLTPPPPESKTKGLTYGSIHTEAGEEIRKSWDAGNIAMVGLITAAVLAMYLYFSFWLR